MGCTSKDKGTKSITLSGAPALRSSDVAVTGWGRRGGCVRICLVQFVSRGVWALSSFELGGKRRLKPGKGIFFSPPTSNLGTRFALYGF